MRELPPTNLDGFEPPFPISEYQWGSHVTLPNGQVWKYMQYHAEVLSVHDHDYLGTHMFVQVWDYAQQNDPDQRWQYMLLLHRPGRIRNADGLIVDTDWGWIIRCEYEERPSHSQVGADIDFWLEAPDCLRFILE